MSFRVFKATFLPALSRASIVAPRIVVPFTRTLTFQRPLTISSIAREPVAEPVVATTKIGSGRGSRAQKDQAKEAKEAKAKDRAKAKEKKEKEKVKLATKKEHLKEKKEKEKEKEKKKASKLLPKVDAVTGKPKLLRTTLKAPKAPGNSWTVFLTDYLAERTRKDPSAPKLNVPGITQEAAPRYNALSTYEKEQLLSRVAEEREQYPALLKAWMDTLTPEMIKDENLLRYRRRKAGLSNRKNLKLAGEPKSPLTPYMSFNKEQRADLNGPVLNGETDVVEQTKVIAAAWRALSDEERQVYTDASKAAHEAYKVEREAFRQKRASLVPAAAKKVEKAEAAQ